MLSPSYRERLKDKAVFSVRVGLGAPVDRLGPGCAAFGGKARILRQMPCPAHELAVTETSFLRVAPSCP